MEWSDRVDVYRVSQKITGTLNFRYFDIRKYSIFWFHQIKHCLLKRMIPRSLKLVEQFLIYGHFSKYGQCVNFPFKVLVTFQSGIMAFLTSIHWCPEAHWSVQTKQRENLWTAIPAVNSSRRFNKIGEMAVESNSILPNKIEWSWYHSFQKTMFYLHGEIKICNIFEYQSNEYRAFRFFGDTRYKGEILRNPGRIWRVDEDNFTPNPLIFPRIPPWWWGVWATGWQAAGTGSQAWLDLNYPTFQEDTHHSMTHLISSPNKPRKDQIIDQSLKKNENLVRRNNNFCWLAIMMSFIENLKTKMSLWWWWLSTWHG